MSLQGKTYLQEDDLINHPIWAYNEIDELLYPVLNESDFPDSHKDLFIRAKFITASGLHFNGYIIGLKNIYSITIFYKGKKFNLNKNLLDSSIEKIKELSLTLNKSIEITEFSPLIYETTIDLPGYNNIKGEFDMLKPRTDVERLDF